MMTKYLDQFEVLSVVGMCKNAGKTTVVNKMIETIFNQYKLGITSIGIDGETVDLVTNTHKPEIYVPKHTLVATAKATLAECDITYKVVKVFDFTTPLGKIVLVESLSDGFVKIAGPSFNSQLEVIVNEFKQYGAEKNYY
jgi:Ni2+-binding GTPase involved in maturation of urease and hydrogenase